MSKEISKDISTYIIIGGGIAGVSAAEAIREVDKAGRITLICKEAELPYYRMNLTRYLAGDINVSALPLHPDEWYKKQSVELMLNTAVESINPAKKEISLVRDGTLRYDKLILANGAQPFMPPFPGRDLKGVWSVRTHNDADNILYCCLPEMHIVCIGGGLLGLENAGALAKRGADVTVIETFDWLLPRQLPKDGGKQLEKLILRMGIKVVTGGKVKEMRGDEKVRAVAFEDGSELPADLVLITTGVAADTELAKAAGLKVNKGVIVDSQMRTSEPDIYAAGDISEWNGKLYGLWMPAKTQGAVAGHNAAGQNDIFPDLPPSAKLKVLGIDLFSIGQIAPTEAGDVLVSDASGEDFTGFVLRDGKLIGASLLGDVSLADEVKTAVNTGIVFRSETNKPLTVADINAALRLQAS
ncbi:MAG TPA: FAD-dependent oxidoreductase [Anaerolineaceae bacterium]|nr:FAD-dependent oxidoreductase [Anaerolineaceae bacterium]